MEANRWIKITDDHVAPVYPNTNPPSFGIFTAGSIYKARILLIVIPGYGQHEIVLVKQPVGKEEYDVTGHCALYTGPTPRPGTPYVVNNLMGVGDMAGESSPISLLKTKIKNEMSFKLSGEGISMTFSDITDAIRAFKKELKKTDAHIADLEDNDQELDEDIVLKITCHGEKGSKVVIAQQTWFADTDAEDDSDPDEFSEDDLLNGTETYLDDKAIIPESQINQEDCIIQYKLDGNGIEAIGIDINEGKKLFKAELRRLERMEEEEDVNWAEDFDIELSTRYLNMSNGQHTAWNLHSSKTFYAASEPEDE